MLDRRGKIESFACDKIRVIVSRLCCFKKKYTYIHLYKYIYSCTRAISREKYFNDDVTNLNRRMNVTSDTHCIGSVNLYI